MNEFVKRLESNGPDGNYTDETKQVIDAIHKRLYPTIDHAESEEDSSRLYKQCETDTNMFNEVEVLVRKLADVVNVMGREKVLAMALYSGLTSQHRTLQAGLIQAIIDALKMYAGTSYDLRNAGAVAACQIIKEKVDEAGISIPLI